MNLNTSLTSLVDIISSVGAPIVCTAVLLILCIKMFKDQQSQLDKMLSAILSNKSHPDSEDTEVLDMINDKIHKELTSILENLNSDRSYVYLYHNGGVSSSGLFFQRMTCTCEVVGQGILPVSTQSQNLHKSSYSLMCNSLKDTKMWFIDDIEDLKLSDSFLYEKALSRHAESLYLYSLVNSYGSPIGFIGIDYCSYAKHATQDEIKKVLSSSATKISSLVDIRSEVSK